MTLKSFIKNMLRSACIYFTVLVLVYIIIAAIVNVDGSNLLLEAGRTVLIFVFSLLLALANTVFSVKSISAKLRILLHYIITLFAFYACFMLPLSMKPSGFLIGAVLFSALYFAILGIVAFLKAKYRSNAEKSEHYEKQYSKK